MVFDLTDDTKKNEPENETNEEKIAMNIIKDERTECIHWLETEGFEEGGFVYHDASDTYFRYEKDTKYGTLKVFVYPNGETAGEFIGDNPLSAKNVIDELEEYYGQKLTEYENKLKSAMQEFKDDVQKNVREKLWKENKNLCITYSSMLPDDININNIFNTEISDNFYEMKIRSFDGEFEEMSVNLPIKTFFSVYKGNKTAEEVYNIIKSAVNQIEIGCVPNHADSIQITV